jgi:hypothetical protein
MEEILNNIVNTLKNPIILKIIFLILSILASIIIVDRAKRACSIKRKLNFAFDACSKKISFFKDEVHYNQNIKFLTECLIFMKNEFDETKTLIKEKDKIIALRNLHEKYFDKPYKIDNDLANLNIKPLNFWFTLKIFFTI